MRELVNRRMWLEERSTGDESCYFGVDNMLVSSALLDVLRARLYSHEPERFDALARAILLEVCGGEERVRDNTKQERLVFRTPIDELFPVALVKQARHVGCGVLYGENYKPLPARW